MVQENVQNSIEKMLRKMPGKQRLKWIKILCASVCIASTRLFKKYIGSHTKTTKMVFKIVCSYRKRPILTIHERCTRFKWCLAIVSCKRKTEKQEKQRYTVHCKYVNVKNIFFQDAKKRKMISSIKNCVITIKNKILDWQRNFFYCSLTRTHNSLLYLSYCHLNALHKYLSHFFKVWCALFTFTFNVYCYNSFI